MDLDQNFSLVAYGVESGDVIVLYEPESELLTVHFNAPLKESGYNTTCIIHQPPYAPELLMWSIAIRLPRCKIEPHANVFRLQLLIQEKVGMPV